MLQPRMRAVTCGACQVTRANKNRHNQLGSLKPYPKSFSYNTLKACHARRAAPHKSSYNRTAAGMRARLCMLFSMGVCPPCTHRMQAKTPPNPPRSMRSTRRRTISHHTRSTQPRTTQYTPTCLAFPHESPTHNYHAAPASEGSVSSGCWSTSQCFGS